MTVSGSSSSGTFAEAATFPNGCTVSTTGSYSVSGSSLTLTLATCSASPSGCVCTASINQPSTNPYSFTPDCRSLTLYDPISGSSITGTRSSAATLGAAFMLVCSGLALLLL